MTFSVNSSAAHESIAAGDRVRRTDPNCADLIGTVRASDIEMLCVEYDHEPGVTGWWWRDCFELLPPDRGFCS